MTDKQQTREIQISVNEQPVTMAQHEATGLEIKETAIKQAVKIKVDFVLSEELGERNYRVVGDQDVVKLHPRKKFIAVAPDDNS